MIKVSIIIPVYNAEKYLGRMSGQSFKPNIYRIWKLSVWMTVPQTVLQRF